MIRNTIYIIIAMILVSLGAMAFSSGKNQELAQLRFSEITTFLFEGEGIPSPDQRQKSINALIHETKVFFHIHLRVPV